MVSLACRCRCQQARPSPQVKGPLNGQRAALNWAADHPLGAVAQLGERRHGMAEARGSSPLSSTPSASRPVERTVGTPSCPVSRNPPATVPLRARGSLRVMSTDGLTPERRGRDHHELINPDERGRSPAGPTGRSGARWGRRRGAVRRRRSRRRARTGPLHRFRERLDPLVGLPSPRPGSAVRPNPGAARLGPPERAHDQTGGYPPPGQQAESADRHAVHQPRRTRRHRRRPHQGRSR